MPTLEVEISEKGEIGTLPEPLQKFLDEKFKEGYGKGAEKTAREAQKQIDDAVKKAREEERARTNGNPADAEKAKLLEVELSKLKEDEARREKNFEEAQRLRDERYARETADRDKKYAEEQAAAKAAIEKREARLRLNVRTDIKAEAVKAGTRDASIDEVSELLEKFVGLDDEFEPTVNADAFRAKYTESKLGEDGKPVSIEGLVAEYLTLKPHHKAPVPGKGGGARGGFSTTGSGKGKDAEKEAALDAVANDPSLQNAAAVIGRIRSRVAS